MFSLHYDHASLVDDREPSRYIRHIKGEVWEFVGEDGHEVPIGRFSVSIIDGASILNDRVSLFDVFDDDGDLMNYYESLYGHNDELKPEVLKAMKVDMIFDHGLLVLDRLELMPERRGLRVGLQVLLWMEHHFRMGCGVVAMKPFPLQFEGGTPEEREADEGDESFKRLRLGGYERRLDVAVRRLRKHYATLGFAMVPGTPYMVADPYRRVVRAEASRALRRRGNGGAGGERVGAQLKA